MANIIQRDSTSNKGFLYLLVILGGLSALAMGIRALTAPWRPTFPDSFTYLKLSESILNGKFFVEHWATTDFYSPYLPKSLYSFLIACIGYISGNLEITATLISVIAGGVLILPVFYLGKTLFGRVTAWIGVVLILFNPDMIIFSGWILTESVFTLLFVACISVSIMILTYGAPWYAWIFLGALSGLVFITREVGFIVFLMIILWTIVYQIAARRMRFHKIAQLLTLLIFGFLMIYLPVKMVFQHINISIAKQRPVVTPSSVIKEENKVSLLERFEIRIAQIASTPDLKKPQAYEKTNGALTPDGSGYGSPTAIEGLHHTGLVDVIRDVGPKLLDLVWEGIKRFAKNFWTSFPKPLIIFLFVGLFCNLLRGKKPEGTLLTNFYLLTWVIGFYAILIIAGSAYFAAGGFELYRYTIPLFPIFFLWTGYGIHLVGDWTARGIEKVGITINRLIVQKLITVALALFILSTFLPMAKNLNFYGSNEKPFEFERIVGKEIRKRISHPPLVMARRPAIPYYAGGSFLITPYEPYDRVLEFARKKGVDFIVIGTIDSRPLLKDLLSVSAPKPGMKYQFGIRDRRDSDHLLFAVYRVEE